jgi:hypothetical protein
MSVVHIGTGGGRDSAARDWLQNASESLSTYETQLVNVLELYKGKPPHKTKVFDALDGYYWKDVVGTITQFSRQLPIGFEVPPFKEIDIYKNLAVNGSSDVYVALKAYQQAVKTFLAQCKYSLDKAGNLSTYPLGRLWATVADAQRTLQTCVYFGLGPGLGSGGPKFGPQCLGLGGA